MTNAEKYLKGITPYEFAREYGLYCYNYERGMSGSPADKMGRFLKAEAKPTLTEDESVILRNIKGYTTIIRNIEGNIQAENNDGSFACLCAFNHLFQFIKNGEEYSIEKLLKGE